MRRGDAPEILDLGATETPGALLLEHAGAAGRFDLIFSINIGGEFKDSLGRTLPDLYGGPHVVWHTDYVFSQAARIRGTPKSTAVLVVDPTQADVIRAIYGADRFDHLAFFPHPAVGEPAADTRP